MPCEAAQPDVLFRFVVQLESVVAAAAAGGSDMGPARGLVEGAGVARSLDEDLDEYGVVW